MRKSAWGVVAILAVLAMALGAFSIPGALATGSDDGHQEKAPETFPHPDNDLVKAQTPLLGVVDDLDGLIAEAGIEGFVGAKIEPENNKLFIFWHGDVPGEVANLLEQSADRGEIVVEQVPHSLQELEELTVAVLEEHPEFADGGPTDTFDQLQFSVVEEEVSASYDYESMSSELTSATGVDVELMAGDWSMPTDFSRSSDVSPFWGGATIVSGDVLCSTGFAARKQATDQPVMIGANHCDVDDDTPGEDWVTENGDRFVGRVADDGHRDATLDTMLLSGEAYESAIYIGDPESSVGAPVIGASRNVIGAIVTNSGGLSGEVGNNRIDLVSQFVRIGDDILGPGFFSDNLDGVAQSGQGDSGGPVVRPVVHPDDETKWALRGQGINTAVSEFTECSGRDEDRLCGTRAFAMDLPRILEEFQLALP